MTCPNFVQNAMLLFLVLANQHKLANHELESIKTKTNNKIWNLVIYNGDKIKDN